MARILFKAGFILLVLASLANKTFGQVKASGGGRAIAMAETSLLLEDEFGLFNNPAAITTRQISLLLNYYTRYLSLGITDAQVGLVLPLGSFNAGLGLSYFGDNLFNQVEINSVFSHQVGFASLGIRTGYHQFYLENYGYRRNINIDIGGVFNLSEQVQFAMLITNLTRAKLSGQENYRLSSLLALGLSYQPVKAFRIDLQVNKDINLPVTGSFGMEYHFSQHVSARTGFNLTNSTGALGFGFHWNQFSLDLAANYQPRLGLSTALSLCITRKNAN